MVISKCALKMIAQILAIVSMVVMQKENSVERIILL